MNKTMANQQNAAAPGGRQVAGAVGERVHGDFHDIQGVAADGKYVWVTDRYVGDFQDDGRVIVFERTANDHIYVGECPVPSAYRIAAAGNRAWISTKTGKIQEVELRENQLINTRIVLEGLDVPNALCYRATADTLLICCSDSVKVVNVADGRVSTSLRIEQNWEGPHAVAVLNDRVLVAYKHNMVLYTGDDGRSYILKIKARLDIRDLTHYIDDFVVCDANSRRLLKVDQDGLFQDPLWNGGTVNLIPTCVSASCDGYIYIAEYDKEIMSSRSLVWLFP